ncbi:phage lysozyme [Burkholderia sp. YI23]|nr:phage lysozyme [Burkholderia sp. YI23]
MNAYDLPTLKAELTRDEGRRARIYVDTVGKTSGGVGRNLSDVAFSDDEIDLMLSNDIERAELSLDARLPWWRNLDPVRQRVILNMCFNMGIAGLLTFVNTLAFVKSGNWNAAANGMLASKWANQVGARAQRLAQMMRTGSA